MSTMIQKITFGILSMILLATVGTALVVNQSVQAATCGGVDVAFLECDESNPAEPGDDPVEASALWRILEMVLNIMIGLVGIAAVGGLVFAAIVYSSAQDNASQVQQAKDTIRNVVIGIVMFLFMWTGLQYLIPGGVF